jgi:microcystin-dependent protein
VSGVSGVNNTFTSANLVNSVATTKTASDSTTAVATTAFVHAVLPTGIIVMWNSTAASIPAGWQLCNGSNGTPDLRGQFVVGAGGSYTPGDTGGAASVTLSATAMPIHTHELTGSLTTGSAGSHTHTTSVTDPGHSHTLPLIQQVGTFGSQLHGAWNGGSTATTASTTGISVTVDTALAHTHSLTLSGNTQSTGGSGGTTQPHENRPPYYALCYIQKMY